MVMAYIRLIDGILYFYLFHEWCLILPTILTMVYEHRVIFVNAVAGLTEEDPTLQNPEHEQNECVVEWVRV